MAKIHDSRGDNDKAIDCLKSIKYEGECIEEKLDDYLTLAE